MMKMTKQFLLEAQINEPKKNIVYTAHVYERGSTLIEVLISMLILSMGIIALVSTQTRIAMGIREAENLSRVAQAAQNMAEAMLIKPKLVSTKSGSNFLRPRKDYSAYTITGCDNDVAVGATLTTDNWAQSVKNDFCADIRKVIGAGTNEKLSNKLILVTIQNGKRLDKGINECTRTTEGTWSLESCNKLEEGNQTVLQVIWKMDEESDIAYSYQVALGESE